MTNIPQYKGNNSWCTSEKKIGWVLFSLAEMAIWKGCGKGLDF
jgi:hypothetical protein